MSLRSDPNSTVVPLYQVLEEEFAELHGPPRQTDPRGASTDPEVRLAAIYQQIHALREKRSALCLSGGGIRSATFALGVMQGLARGGLLDRFHFLSTVSGGGYIGGWLSAWIYRCKHDVSAVIQQLGCAVASKRTEPEPEPVNRLRQYSNYLSPKLGALSADSWTLAATYIRNLLLNWIVLLPVLTALLMLPRIFASLVNHWPNAFTIWLMPPLVLLGTVGAILCTRYMGLNLPSEIRRPTHHAAPDFRRDETDFLRWCLAPCAVCAFALSIFWAWFTNLNAWEMFSTSWTRWLFAHQDFVAFLLFGTLIHLLALVTCLFGGKRFKPAEVLGVVVSGAFGGWLLWLGATKIFFHGGYSVLLWTCFGAPFILLLYFLALAVYVGVTSNHAADEDREWWARAGGWLLIALAGWTLLAVIVVHGPPLLYHFTGTVTSAGGAAGLLTLLAGRSTATPATALDAKPSRGFGTLVLEKAGTFAAPIFAAFLLILISAGTTWLFSFLISNFHAWIDWNRGWVDLSHAANGEAAQTGYAYWHYLCIVRTPAALAAGLFGFLLICGVGVSKLVNTNRFSLHAIYRARLIRAYLGASNLLRRPQPFTGFDETDNVPMHRLWPRPGEARSTADRQRPRRRQLFHVVNIALNLVRGKKLAWQQRMAESFTVTPLHCGSFHIQGGFGYRRTVYAPQESHEKTLYYGGRDGISLGTAVTISGAAASPNMGYHTSTLVTFLLTVFNVRLGWWLGNPGKPGDRTFHRSGPELSLDPIIDELIGRTNDENEYVYLSDGGHFENLGVYEMVLRRCHYVVVSDAGQDASGAFTDLGDAVRKIRIDFGIPIEFDEMKIHARGPDGTKAERGYRCAVGRIRYECADGPGAPDGVLIYIKPAWYGDEPRDICEYAVGNPLFPHESTADQFFTESQFESYRMLGLHSVEEILGENWNPQELDGDGIDRLEHFLRHIYRQHFQQEVPGWLRDTFGQEPRPSFLQRLFRRC